MDQLTVIQALNAVAADVGAVRKGERNQMQGFNFRGIDAVVNAVSGPMRRHGVVVVPEVVSVDLRESRTAKGTTMQNVHLIVDYQFYGPTGDSVTARVAAESFDSGDKATAKAMSVAFRTALLQVLCLPTDEPDPDATSYARAAATRRSVSDEQIQAASSVDELRALWSAATPEQQQQIRVRADQFTVEAGGKS